MNIDPAILEEFSGQVCHYSLCAITVYVYTHLTVWNSSFYIDHSANFWTFGLVQCCFGSEVYED